MYVRHLSAITLAAYVLIIKHKCWSLPTRARLHWTICVRARVPIFVCTCEYRVETLHNLWLQHWQTLHIYISRERFFYCQDCHEIYCVLMIPKMKTNILRGQTFSIYALHEFSFCTTLRPSTLCTIYLIICRLPLNLLRKRTNSRGLHESLRSTNLQFPYNIFIP